MRNIRTFPQLLVRVFVRPLFPFLQWSITTSGLVEPPPPRQPFLLGTLSTPLKAAIVHLKKNGFFTNRLAFVDSGEYASLRRLCDTRPSWQYHIRIYNDGEVRGHYERTPEDYPRQHLAGVGQIEGKEMFLTWISDIIKT